jgi:hypothetical protein
MDMTPPYPYMLSLFTQGITWVACPSLQILVRAPPVHVLLFASKRFPTVAAFEALRTSFRFVAKRPIELHGAVGNG